MLPRVQRPAYLLYIAYGEQLTQSDTPLFHLYVVALPLGAFLPLALMRMLPNPRLRGGTGPSYPSSRAGPGPGPSAPGRLPPGRTAGGSVPSSSSVSAARSTAAAPSQYGRASPYGSTGSTSPPGRTAPASAVAASGGDWRPTGLLASRYPARVAVGWQSGPTDPSGVLCDLSDRPNTCSAADWARGEVVVGSTDHALYVLDVVKGVRKRTLYNKSCGHTE